MRPREIRDAGRLTGRTLGDVAAVVRDVHRATSRRVFDTLGPVATPVRWAHDSISAVAHTSTAVGVRGIPVVAGLVGAGVQAARGGGRTVHDSPTGRFTTAAVAGVFGDRIARDQPALAPPLAVRTERGPLRRSPADLVDDVVADAGPAGVGGRVVVFAHGLCESDMSWRVGARRHWGDPDVTYGSRLRDDAGWTPLYLTYNTGRHVADNGRDVAGLLAAVVDRWPVPVTDIALIGHSMGGLVLRSAVAQSNGQAWSKSLRHLVFLGTPHLGAPLEQAVHRAGHTLAAQPETAPFATLLRRRSVGIKDLRHGALVAADWGDAHPDDDLPDRCTVTPFPDGVAVHAVGVTLARRHDSVLGRTVGDLLVRFESAGSLGHATRVLPGDGVLHLGGLHHFDLLDHPGVYAVLRDRLR